MARWITRAPTFRRRRRTPIAALSSNIRALTATGITVSPVVGTPAVGQVHVLTATGITASPTVGTPAVGQVHVLTATGITVSPAVGSPSIGQVHALTATGITASPAVGSPDLGQIHVLAATGVTVSPTVGAPGVGQVHALVATGIDTGAPTVDTPALSESSNTDALTADGITVSPVVGTPAITERRRSSGSSGWEEWKKNKDRPAEPTARDVERMVDEIIARYNRPKPVPPLPALLKAVSAPVQSAVPAVERPAPIALSAVGIVCGRPQVGRPALATHDDDEIMEILLMVA